MKIFIPGPVNIRSELFDEALQLPFGHRDVLGQQLVSEIKANLLALAGADSSEYSCLLINGSGTNGMESVVRSLIPGGGERAAVLSIGSFGDLFHRLALASEKRDIYLHREKVGSVLSLDVLSQIPEIMRADYLLVTHNESSTGVTNDLSALSEWALRNGKQLIVDGVSIFGGAAVRLDEWKPLAYISSSQKCLGLSAGLSVVFLRTELARDLIKQCKSRGYTTDLAQHLAYSEKNELLSTPNCALIRQLHAQLDFIVNQEGSQARFERHRKLQSLTTQWSERMGLSLLASEASARSPTLTSIKLGSAYNLEKLKMRMQAHGYLIDVGYPSISAELIKEFSQRYFRVAHMGDLQEDELLEFLNVLGENI